MGAGFLNWIGRVLECFAFYVAAQSTVLSLDPRLNS
jgi:hypothetical protein